MTTASISATAGAFLPKVNSQSRIAPRTLGSTAEGPGGDVYEKETALFRDSTRLTVGSLDNGLRKNEDGSVDMPGSVTSVFSEAEDFAAALREEGFVGLLVIDPASITGMSRWRNRCSRSGR